jgi:hypothetical protein
MWLDDDMTTTTATNTTAQVLDYNAGQYDSDERDAILNGTEGVSVTIHSKVGSRDVRVVVTVGVRDADGYFWGAAPSQYFTTRPSREWNYKRMTAYYASKVAPNMEVI